MDEAEFFAPWRLVAAFADGSRLTFDGLTEEQAQEAMEAAQKEHGDIGWYDGVTDVNYENGRYYKTKERRTAREEGELCRFVRMAPDGGVELISNAGNVVRFKNAEDLTKTLRFAKDVLRITEVLKNGNQN